MEGVLNSFAPAGITEYTIPGSVTSIGDYAFAGRSSLTSVTIPDSVTSIGNSAFLNCSSLTSVTIQDSVTTIGNRAYCGCSSLTCITIPDSVTSIGRYAFQSCTKLGSVFCKAAIPPTLHDDTFANNNDERYIYVPSASVEAYKRASGWSEYASHIFGYDF